MQKTFTARRTFTNLHLISPPPRGSTIDMLRSLVLLCSAAASAGFRPAVFSQPTRTHVARTTDVSMINLFGNNDESRKQRDELSLRDARPGDRKVTFRKPNAATQGIQLGLKFTEDFGKAVYIDKIVEGTEAAKLKKEGKIKEGDEVTMVSATFGDEMWSARRIGKMRLEKSIAVRQGMTISFVFESKDQKAKQNNSARQKEIEKEKERMTRMQKQLLNEVEQEKKKGWSIFG